jgi:hypothetical protein
VYYKYYREGINMVSAPDIRHQKEKPKNIISMGLTPFEKRALEASIKKNRKALELLSQH